MAATLNRILKKVEDLGDEYFGEGLTIMNDKIYINNSII